MKERVEHIAATWPRGSALILTVVLTSLLAIVGVLFVMASRIDRMATTAATESRELTCALDTVLAQINQALIDDVPGVTPNQEYYDYPDDKNPWLADLEPYASGSGSARKYYWRQISNLVGSSMVRANDLTIQVVGERDPIDPNLTADPSLTTADADGDGVGDARWFRVPDMMTSKGRPFYAAVRIVDHGAMLNMNTGFRPGQADPNESRDPNDSGVDGTSQLQINVLTLAAAPGSQPQTQDETTLLKARANNGANAAATRNLDDYERKVIWQYLDVKNPGVSQPSPYTPFDMSDELELRYRYLLNQKNTNTRVEDCGRFRTNAISTPVDSGGRDLDVWFRRAAGGGADPNYAYRHIATTYNMDRIITPEPLELADGTRRRKMVNVNTTDEDTLRTAIAAALTTADPNGDSAQITANLRDYIDDDDEVTVLSGLSSPYFGFERPCIYISELACRQVLDAAGQPRSSYAIELYRPYFEDRDPKPDEWRLVITNPSRPTGPQIQVSLTWSGSRRFHVILAEDPAALLSEDYVVFADAEEPADTMPLYGYSRNDYEGAPQQLDPTAFWFEAGSTISLQRVVPGAANPPYVDFVRVPDGWMQADDVARSLQRDISPHKCVRRLWAPATQPSIPALGNAVGSYVDTQRPETIQAHPANKPLTNIGELGMIFRESVYSLREGALAADALLDLADPSNSKLFNYLTVIDPARWRDPNETRITGRININTAPAFVLAQLPWMRYGESTAFGRATDIVNYRVGSGAGNPYRSIGDLMQIPSMRSLMFDQLDNQYADTPRGPDLTPDTARDDFEERDLIFRRISDLVTVRSDVFTAYVLVRIGESGPQRRIVAIVDRSRVDSSGGKVRLVAWHLVPDPR